MWCWTPSFSALCHVLFHLLGSEVLDIVQQSLQLMGLVDGCYIYYDDLYKLSISGGTPIAALSAIPPPSPVVVSSMAAHLSSYPDQRLANYILSGLRLGFRIGVSDCFQVRPSARNHPSCQDNPSAVGAYLLSEQAAGRIVCMGGYNQRDIHVSPLGLVPKGNQGTAWRMIVDLSHPDGRSVNDDISPDLCSLSYPSVDNAVEYILTLGRFTELVKVDLKNAYRMLPIHPGDRHLLGMQWDSGVYVDLCLPFGLRSAPKIFTAFSDVLAWILLKCGVKHLIHYLDDFLFFGSPFTDEGGRFLSIALEVLAELGVPVSMDKLEGPSTTVTFLGILVDTVRLELRLPDDKLSRLRALVSGWLGRRSGRRSELESLLGHLSHAAVVVRPGRIFLRQLFSVMSRASKRHHFVHLDTVAKADLAWWNCFLQHWHGASFLTPSEPVAVHVYSDASGSFGCGAFTSMMEWIQVEWPVSWQEVDISVKELVPVVMAAAVWGRSWRQCHIIFHSDNAAVVAVVQRKTAKHPSLLHLVRCLYFYAAHFHFSYDAQHVPGVVNVAADALSRNNMSLFHSLIPQAARSTVGQALMELLVLRRPDWGSRDWIALFRATL